MTITIGPPTPVNINQLAEEFDEALELYREVKPQRVLEVGTAAGGSLYHWIKNATTDAVIVSVDIDMSQISYEIVDEWARGEFGLPDVMTLLVQGDTRTPWTQAEIEEKAPYDWLFIDGCHEYEYARNDWEAFRPMCNPGAYVLFHDIALQREYGDGRTAGVHRLWRELQAEGFWTRELRADPTLTSYGIGVLRLP